jgi:hypothetical protein
MKNGGHVTARKQKVHINPGLSLPLDEKRGSRHDESPHLRLEGGYVAKCGDVSLNRGVLPMPAK